MTPQPSDSAATPDPMRAVPFKANSKGHLVYVWSNDGQEIWACCAYDHGPFCRLCQKCDAVTLTLLGHVKDGNMEVRADSDGSFRFNLTEQGDARAKALIEQPGELRDLWDNLVITDMEKDFRD